MEIPTNYILFLKGVFPEDCSKVEDQYIENLNDNASFIDDMHKNGDIKRKVQYDKIQKHFYSIKTWVESTKNIKIKCWYCESMFMGVPVFIPSNIHDSPKGKIYDVHGIFCTFGCAFSFIKASAKFIDDKSQWDKVEMLKMLYFLFYNRKIDTIIPSPDKYKLEQYGGDMTLVEFKKELKKINLHNIGTIPHL
jgi:hypothetical protein